MAFRFLCNCATPVLFLVFLFQWQNVSSQNLLKSEAYARHAYIYNITTDQAKRFYKDEFPDYNSAYFEKLVDSFPINETYDKLLEPGYYLKVEIRDNKIQTELTSVQDYNVFIYNNDKDLNLRVLDLDGNSISDAKVKLKSKKVRFDESTKTYTLKKNYRQGLLSVEYNNQTIFYDLKRSDKRGFILRQYHNIMFGTPIKYVWRPVKFVIDIPVDAYRSIFKGYGATGSIFKLKQFAKDLYDDVLCLFDKYRCKNPTTYGYIITNKPKYRPNDSVKVKAYILDKRYKAMTKPLYLVLSADRKNIKLGKVEPYADGGYAFDFKLEDSLGLKLDKRYSLRLRDDDFNTYESISFYYEDYTLKGNTLEITSEKDTQYRGDSLAFFVEAKDENELFLMDADVEIWLQSTNEYQTFEDRIFIPDTLWKTSKKLNPKSKTELNIPPDIFPKANLDYIIRAKLKTADNEITKSKLRVSYVYYKDEIRNEVINDSIGLYFTKNDKKTPQKANLYLSDAFDNTDSITQIELPFKLPLNPYKSYMTIQTDSLKKIINFDNYPTNVSVSSRRDKDSIIVSIANPRGLNLLYHTYKVNSEIDKGETNSKSVQLKYAAKNKKNYYLSLSYLWAGKVKTINYNIKLLESELNVYVKQPRLIYPGKTDTIRVKVLDYKNKPVEDVDLSAYGITKKFNYNPPRLTSFEKKKKPKTIINNYSFNNDAYKPFSNDLIYDEWKKKAHLDSIIYYDFMYPKDVFITEVKANDSITQFAPFVMNNGLQEEIKVIYIDNNPIYMSWNNHKQFYSFKIDSGYHDIRLRTAWKSYDIDSVYFKPFKKTIFSIDKNTRSQNVVTTDLTPTLTEIEKRQLYPRIMYYDEHEYMFLAYIKSNNKYFLLDEKTRRFGNKNNLITGPIYGDFQFSTYDSLFYTQIHESYYKYNFYPDYLKLKSIDKNILPNTFSYSNSVQNLDDKVLTKALIQDIWKEKILQKRQRQPYRNYPYKTQKGYATLVLNDKNPHPDKIILNTIIVDDNRDTFRVYSSLPRTIHNLEPKTYKVLILFTDMTYQVLDSLVLKPYGFNVRSFDQPETYLKDELSTIFNDILSYDSPNLNSREAYKAHINRLRIAYNRIEPYFGEGFFVTGTVKDSDGLPIPAVNVVIKGTTNGVQTDFDGRYILKVPNIDDILVFSYVGFKTLEQPADIVSDVVMQDNLESLDEVVVTSYRGIVKESKVVSASSTVHSEAIGQVSVASIDQVLQGMVAGANVSYYNGQPGQAGKVNIRGRTSITGVNEPLYIIDGVPVSREHFRALNSSDVLSMRILKDAAATALYGNKASAGVIIIDTKMGSNPIQNNPNLELNSDFYNQNASASSIRTNFSDEAYWNTRLRTDKNGEAEFIVTYPDDITSWETFILAMNEDKQSGEYSSTIKSYKPISARLYTPKFLIEGDKVKAIGKTLNYTSDTLDISTSLEVNGKSIFKKDISSSNAQIDSLSITAVQDTIDIMYKLQQQNSDYFDGEKRSIPVFRKGVEVSQGVFRVLMPSDTLKYIAKQEGKPIHFYAESDVIKLIETNIDQVINYTYECNEQLASKLNMLLTKQKIYNQLQKPFDEDKLIKKLIKKLQKNKNTEYLWGWWKSSKEPNYWITNHVLKALLKAKQSGYTTTINEESYSVYLKNEYFRKSNISKQIDILSTLSLLDHKPIVGLENEIDSLFRDKETSLTEKLRLSIISSNFEKNTPIHYLKSYQGEDMFGNIYFDEKQTANYSIRHNRNRTTLLAYKLIKSVEPKDPRLDKILLYLLNAKTNGRYLNTYQATNILETVLPDLIKNTSEQLKAKIKINQTQNDEFPIIETRSDSTIIAINTGNVPIYVTAYQEYYKTEPKRLSKDFEIESYFVDKPNQNIENGEEVTLKVRLKVIKEAEYTMISIPIPGGFDYNSKPLNYLIEDHREYFKHKTSIFCSQLKEGTYTFEIPLIAKFSGHFYFNPAKVELMYFPTFHAHEELKQITVD